MSVKNLCFVSKSYRITLLVSLYTHPKLSTPRGTPHAIMMHLLRCEQGFAVLTTPRYFFSLTRCHARFYLPTSFLWQVHYQTWFLMRLSEYSVHYFDRASFVCFRSILCHRAYWACFFYIRPLS